MKQFFKLNLTQSLIVRTQIPPCVSPRKHCCLARAPKLVLSKIRPKTLSNYYSWGSVPPPAAGDPSRLLQELCGRIRLMGPLTVADYMREALQNPLLGYYMRGEVLGSQGDFVTSPEISQVFGECLGIWCLSEWQKMGEVRPLKLVEMGPGKGTLMSDVLRTLRRLKPDTLSDIEVHLVELSPAMRRQQRIALFHDPEDSFELEGARSKYGPKVFWHDSLLDVPTGFSFFLAHEFFDALPVHKFQKTEDGWREILVDIDPKSETPALRFVISRHPTPACTYVTDVEGPTLNLELPQIDITHVEEKRPHLEVCPSVGVLVREMAGRIRRHGGTALIADYGQDGPGGDTLRAFKKHEQVNPLELPGTCDMTADVDFKYMRKHSSDGIAWFGPKSQGEFLHNLGISLRIRQLLKSSDDSLHEMLLSSYDTLTNAEKMGTRFKFVAMFPETMKEIHEKYPPVGFQDTPIFGGTIKV